MKTFTRVIAVVMLVAVLAAMMAACGDKKNEPAPTEEDKGIVNDMLVGTWEGTDSDDVACTWVFNSDKTCTLTKGDVTKNGTYVIHSENNGKIDILLDGEEKERMTYTCTKIKLILSGFGYAYDCTKKK